MFVSCCDLFYIEQYTNEITEPETAFTDLTLSYSIREMAGVLA